MLLRLINKTKINLDEFKLIQEFHIPFTNKRADYLIINKNKILILEFSYSHWKDTEYQFQTKLNQVINYKELLSNLISKNIEIGTYTFIINPENINHLANEEQIQNLNNYIEFFFKERYIDALEEIYKLPNSNSIIKNNKINKKIDSQEIDTLFLEETDLILNTDLDFDLDFDLEKKKKKIKINKWNIFKKEKK